MRYRFFWLILVSGALLFSGCGGEAPSEPAAEESPAVETAPNGLSANEDNGIKAVLGFYGGECTYGVGSVDPIDPSLGRYFDIQLKKSEGVEDYADVAQMPASNIARLFHLALKEERTNYTEIRVSISLKDGRTLTFPYETRQLAIVDQRMQYVRSAVEYIQARDYDGLAEFINDSTVVQYDRFVMLDQMADLDATYGNVTGFTPFGFRFSTSQEGREILHVSAIVQRDIQNHQFSVDMDLSARPEELIRMQYQL